MPKKPRQGRYVGQVLEEAKKALATGNLKPGNAYIVDVYHDEWCDQLMGKGVCNCNPIVSPPKRVVNPEEN